MTQPLTDYALSELLVLGSPSDLEVRESSDVASEYVRRPSGREERVDTRVTTLRGRALFGVAAENREAVLDTDLGDAVVAAVRREIEARGDARDWDLDCTYAVVFGGPGGTGVSVSFTGVGR